jgi:hypothetical protein
MLYVGSTLSPALRFHHHLVTGYHSSIPLQAAIAHYGLANFNVYVMKEITFPASASFDQKVNLLRIEEQAIMDKFPIEQLYNKIRSVKVM